MILVVDASVALKWFFRTHDNETDTEEALAILTGIDTGHYKLLQPPHFLAEMAAVLAREKPADVHEDLNNLQHLEWQYFDDPTVYTTAVNLSLQLQHHLFDTLYHAVALDIPDAVLVTADTRYYRKASDQGSIHLLSEWHTRTDNPES